MYLSPLSSKPSILFSGLRCWSWNCKEYHLRPCRQTSWKFLPIQDPGERLGGGRTKKGLPVSHSQHHTTSSARLAPDPASLPTPSTSHPVSPGMSPFWPHPPGHQNATAVRSHQPGCPPPQAQPILPGPSPQLLSSYPAPPLLLSQLLPVGDSGISLSLCQTSDTWGADSTYETSSGWNTYHDLGCLTGP